MPVYELLDGLYREKMEFTGLIHMHGVEEDVASAIRFKKNGYRVLKIKVGFDLHKDMEGLAAICEAVGPDAALHPKEWSYRYFFLSR